MTASEIKDILSKEYPFRIELHAHTNPVSGCSEILPEEMAKIYNQKGYDGIVITNHLFPWDAKDKESYITRHLSGYEETKKAAEGTNLKVYLGAEVRFEENSNDYLIYGVDREILESFFDYYKKGIKAFRTEVKLPNSVFVQAHPFRNGMVRAESQYLDGIETLNLHPNHNSAVAVATRYAKEQGFKIKTIGSDFHHKNVGHEGVSALRTRFLPKDSFEIAEILKSGDYIFEIGEDALVLP